MEENRSDFFGIPVPEKTEMPVNENEQPIAQPIAEPIEEATVEPIAEPLAGPAKQQLPVQEQKAAPAFEEAPAKVSCVQQTVDSFFSAKTPSENGCTYAYARPAPPVHEQPQAARPQPSYYNPPVRPAQAAYSAPQPTPPPYRPAQQPAGNAFAAAPAAANEKPKQAKAAKKKKKEKKQTNRMSFGQLFICLALCLIVGSISGYVSSKSAVENALDAFKETMTSVPATQSYNVNIIEPTVAPTTPTTEESTEATVPAVNNTSASDIYKQNVNAVVNITAKGVRTVNYGFFFGSQQKEFVSSGSGFFLTEDGYILTNYHVVEGARTFIATDFNGEEHSATLVGFEESNDIAVLKVEGEFQAVELGDSNSLEVGDTLLIIGNALGELQYTLTQGVVSYLERAVTTETGSVINMFQTDAAINSGNSGGPVFNAKGEVVGIASAKYASSTIEGLGFCIPIDDVKYMISDIMNVGYVTGKPSVGVSLYTNTSRSNGLPYGCYIVAVEAGSAADNAGLEVGDVITAVDGKTVQDVDDFGSALSGKRAGDTITLNIYSAAEGRSLQATLTLDEYIPAEPRTEYTNVFDY